ncbi:MAG: DNA/RNA nuclease SfsA [Desulfotalea sp.]
MDFSTTLIKGKLIKRYKRFLADINMSDGTVLTVHCPNTGTMKTCSTPGSDVLLSTSDNPKRKYPNTLEMIYEGTWVGVNTSKANAIVAEGILAGKVSEFPGTTEIKREVTVSKGSRLDLLVYHDGIQTYVEIKNCSMADNGIAMFPDAVTARGTKHLQELVKLKEKGENAAIFFLIQREDVSKFRPAVHIDPVYAENLKIAEKAGVLILAYQAEVTPESIQIKRPLPIEKNY